MLYPVSAPTCEWVPLSPSPPSTPAWVSWPCQSPVVLLFKMHSGQLCSGLKLLHSNFFFHFISGRALELCSLPLPPSSPPAELLPGSIPFPGAPFCSQLLLNPHFFHLLSPSVLLPRRQIRNHKLCYSSNRS